MASEELQCELGQPGCWDAGSTKAWPDIPFLTLKVCHQFSELLSLYFHVFSNIGNLQCETGGGQPSARAAKPS